MFFVKVEKTIFFEREKVSRDTRHALKPFQSAVRHLYAVKGDKNVAQNFLKLLSWFLSSIFLLR